MRGMCAMRWHSLLRLIPASFLPVAGWASDVTSHAEHLAILFAERYSGQGISRWRPRGPYALVFPVTC